MARDLVSRTGLRARGTAEPESASSDVLGDDADLADTVSEILKPQFLKLVEEIKRVCLYAAAETRGGTVSQVYLLGSVARWPGSDRLLSSMTNMRVEKIPNPLALLRGEPQAVPSVAPAPEVAVATGLALRGMTGRG